MAGQHKPRPGPIGRRANHHAPVGPTVRHVTAAFSRRAQVHVQHLNPFPSNLGDVLRSAPRVLVPEMNLGQLSRLLRAEYLVDARSVTKVKGVPFTAGELETAILEALDD